LLFGGLAGIHDAQRTTVGIRIALGGRQNLRQMTEGKHTKTNWNLRDAELAALIEKVVLELAADRPGRRVNLWQVYQRPPDLKAKLSKLDRLPLPRLALERGLRQITSKGVSLQIG
jgi:hypothetical protein